MTFAQWTNDSDIMMYRQDGEITIIVNACPTITRIFTSETDAHDFLVAMLMEGRKVPSWLLGGNL